MKTATSADIAEALKGTPLQCVEGTLTTLWDPEERQTAKGLWRYQNGQIELEGGEKIKIAFNDGAIDKLSQAGGARGAFVRLIIGKDKTGKPAGIKVDTYTDKNGEEVRKVVITSSALITADSPGTGSRVPAASGGNGAPATARTKAGHVVSDAKTRARLIWNCCAVAAEELMATISKMPEGEAKAMMTAMGPEQVQKIGVSVAMTFDGRDNYRPPFFASAPKPKPKEDNIPGIGDESPFGGYVEE